MPITSKTGLLPSAKKIYFSKQEASFGKKILEFSLLAVPAPFTLRPFAGIYNPFPYGCSILCNHPTDLEARAIVQKAKDAWATEGKSLIYLEEHSAIKNQNESDVALQRDESKFEENEYILKESDRDVDTKFSSFASVATKVSPALIKRRCLTPDPVALIPTKEKTLLVLDLRRSHSQETLYWQKDQVSDDNLELSKVLECATEIESNSRAFSPSFQCEVPGKKKKVSRKKSLASSGTASSVKTQNSRSSDSKVQGSVTSSCQNFGTSDQEKADSKIYCTSLDSSSDDGAITKRRGKKRKGKKLGKGRAKEGDKEVKGIPDPNETQVSAIGTDSKENSSNSSLSGEEKTAELNSEEISPLITKENVTYNENERSFLAPEILKELQRQLDQEVIDSELDVKRKKALEEAFRHKPNSNFLPQGEEIKILKKEFEILIKDSETWLSIPRVFTRRSARFELPMDSRLLNDMTPLHYVKNYSFPSSTRLSLYNHVFNLCKEEPEDDEEKERILLGKNVINGLEKIVGKSISFEEAEKFQNLIDWKDEAKLDFRTFTGIAAVYERVIGPQFCTNMPSQKEDPRHEIEQADFETLEYKLRRFRPDKRLEQILRSLRDL